MQHNLNCIYNIVISLTDIFMMHVNIILLHVNITILHVCNRRGGAVGKSVCLACRSLGIRDPADTHLCRKRMPVSQLVQ